MNLGKKPVENEERDPGEVIFRTNFVDLDNPAMLLNVSSHLDTVTRKFLVSTVATVYQRCFFCGPFS